MKKDDEKTQCIIPSNIQNWKAKKSNNLSLKTPKGTEERLYPAVVQLG